MFGLNAEDAGRERRLRRGAGGWGSGDSSEIGFPSLEVALLTLAFLVFAVFLVNMVLVLFSNIFGTNTSTTTSTAALGRRRREAEEARNHETMRVLQALEEFPLRHRVTPAHCHADPDVPCSQEESPLPQIAQFLLGLKL